MAIQPGAGPQSPAARSRRYFALKQQAALIFVALFVGGVLGPLLIVLDPERPYRGIFFVSISVIMLPFGISAWLRLPKDQRSWKALSSR